VPYRGILRTEARCTTCILYIYLKVLGFLACGGPIRFPHELVSISINVARLLVDASISVFWSDFKHYDGFEQPKTTQIVNI
jgi:hypothetical protein